MNFETEQLLFKYEHRSNIHEHKKQIRLGKSNKHVALQNLSIHYT